MLRPATFFYKGSLPLGSYTAVDVFEFVVAVSLHAVELCSSQGSSFSMLKEQDVLTYQGVKAAYSCTSSETCRCVEVREINLLKPKGFFTYHKI